MWRDCSIGPEGKGSVDNILNSHVGDLQEGATAGEYHLTGTELKGAQLTCGAHSPSELITMNLFP